MQEFESIREFYHPTQPSIKTNNKKIVYQEIQPDENIEHLIFCYWQLKTVKPLTSSFVYRVVSDGCIDIFFEQNTPEVNFIMGFCRKYTEFPIGTEFNYIGIRFLPAAFPILFNVNAKTLSNQSQHLSLVSVDLSDWIASTLGSKYTFEKITELLNNKLCDQLRSQSFDLDQRFFNSVNLILQKRGFIDVETDLNTGLSPRQLRRKFNHYIGTTPKVFSNVVRFQYILNAKPSRESMKENKLYYDVGFFDQAHFIKNFKTFYGVIPSEAFR